MNLTMSQTHDLYRAGGWEGEISDYGAQEWRDIRSEIIAVIEAPSERKAADVIRWWDCWYRGYSATGFARRVRVTWARFKEVEAEK